MTNFERESIHLLVNLIDRVELLTHVVLMSTPNFNPDAKAGLTGELTERMRMTRDTIRMARSAITSPDSETGSEQPT